MLEKIAAVPKRLGDLQGAYIALEMGNETNVQKDGTIRLDTCFPVDPTELVLSDPLFNVANPHDQMPKAICNTNRAYDCLDLMSLPDGYLPRTNYRPDVTDSESLSRTPRVPWSEQEPVTEFYRVACRRQLSQAGERTLGPFICLKHSAHVHPVISLTFKEHQKATCFAGMLSSMPADFWVNTTGKGDHYESEYSGGFPFSALQS